MLYFRLPAEENQKWVFVVVKSIPNGMLTLLDMMKGVQKETEMYSNILPRMEEVSHIQFSPKCIHIQSDPQQAFVLSDLKRDGYRMAERLESLDLFHSELVIKKLAQFHASSFVLKTKEQKSMDMFDFGLTECCMEPIKNTLSDLMEILKNEEGFEDIVKKLVKIEVIWN